MGHEATNAATDVAFVAQLHAECLDGVGDCRGVEGLERSHELAGVKFFPLVDSFRHFVFVGGLSALDNLRDHLRASVNLASVATENEVSGIRAVEDLNAVEPCYADFHRLLRDPR